MPPRCERVEADLVLYIERKALRSCRSFLPRNALGSGEIKRENAMRGTIIYALAVAALVVFSTVDPAQANWRGRYEVHGVGEDDMLKMRAGPGIGYNVILGLPDGTAVRVESCEMIGSTLWCSVSLDRARGLKGYVSWVYLREL
jgi:uncharacterized protein YraI